MESKNLATQSDRLPTNPGAAAASSPALVRGWQRCVVTATPVWSLGYAALGISWLLRGRGFPYPAPTPPGEIGPLIAQLGPSLAWIIVLLAGLPAAGLGLAMRYPARSRALRPAFILAGGLLSAVLLLLMTDLNLLTTLAYLPIATFKLLAGDEFGRRFFSGLGSSTLPLQLACLAGGFLWLAATVTYSRRSGAACLACGRRAEPETWTSPARAARWGRIAVYLAMLVPVFYAITRFAWALGIPLGMSVEQLRAGQAAGTWISGLSLAIVGLVGAALMLGLVQRWGEVFPRWIPGLGGRPVPIALAVVPAALMSVLFSVGGLAIAANYTWMASAAAATGQNMEIVVGPVALFLLWGLALAVATLGYYYRRRGPCPVCGRGAPTG